MKRQNAFTLIELMVTLAVLGIGLMIAVPSFVSITRSNRNATETNTLIGALNFARSEATKRSATISVCTSNNGTACTAGSGWASGWIVFVNTDADNPAQVDAGEEILRVYGASSPGNTITSSAALDDSINYNASGFTTSQGEFVLCDNTGVGSARKLSVTRIGRVSLTSTGVGTCNAQ
ncbi:MAG: prepilin-type N-terminal cleavage/methylation domain-containing protein [Gammaproteobacteria bacterium]|nr:prepilin-type N-terminal cleavage/methylation domain-containing protein [Gammaproteobacteria bacterium]